MLPLLATQILWINLVTDGAPALALGVDPADTAGMNAAAAAARRRRDHAPDVGGIFFVGVVMAAGTLLVLDARLPGGLIEGSGTMRYAQTMAFTTLMLFQLFNVFNARSDEESAFAACFRTTGSGRRSPCRSCCRWRWSTCRSCSRRSRPPASSAGDWLLCAAVASSVLWLRELSKIVTRAMAGDRGGTAWARPGAPERPDNARTYDRR